MIFTWHHSEYVEGDPTIPVQSPTMAGGLFSIHKDFFQKLGRYDPGFDIWGGENLELSFKSWMCGGRLEILPCSHVGHIFRSRSPYKWRPGTNVLKKNSIRLAQVWLDDFKQIYFDRINNKLEDYGNITERLDLRRNLKCRRYICRILNWYLTNFIQLSVVSGKCLSRAICSHKSFKNWSYQKCHRGIMSYNTKRKEKGHASQTSARFAMQRVQKPCLEWANMAVLW